jgi:hypothetical protein
MLRRACRATTTGMAFDVNGGCKTVGDPCLYATTFDKNTIYVFDVTGTYVGTCGALNAADPAGVSNIESATIVPGYSGGPSLFFGQADGDRQILQYPLPCDSSSTPTASFTVCTGTTGTCPTGAGANRGTDWVDMTSNNCDIQYTSESTSVLDYNVCTNTQGPDFADGLPNYAAYAHRALSDGRVLVGDTSYVALLSNTGTLVNTCDSSGSASSETFSMDVLPDQNSFAVAGLGGSGVDYLTVAHCAAGQATADFSFSGMQSGQSGLIGGVAIFGEFTQSNPPPTGAPEFNAPAIMVAAVAVFAVALMRRMKMPSVPPVGRA